ncbi:hypothetical protein PF010_g20469 [Phytophthora fragariae]|uniref:Uncharacterized protein n=1 Tax=Phytophthora fragariae TaxID=53985 RepID=A0A6A4CEW5_9STRA|nr:hypothetical protein PF003_g38761 [Phytophthora fragariae]KAE9085400.1 hypothetical protein PF010_g20469 [Phytophthora fragariae]KAE9289179.1 hypothetical protein PF001_g20166 [Phytophthora fragariae]
MLEGGSEKVLVVFEAQVTHDIVPGAFRFASSHGICVDGGSLKEYSTGDYHCCTCAYAAWVPCEGVPEPLRRLLANFSFCTAFAWKRAVKRNTWIHYVCSSVNTIFNQCVLVHNQARPC